MGRKRAYGGCVSVNLSFSSSRDDKIQGVANRVIKMGWRGRSLEKASQVLQVRGRISVLCRCHVPTGRLVMGRRKDGIEQKVVTVWCWLSGGEMGLWRGYLETKPWVQVVYLGDGYRKPGRRDQARREGREASKEDNNDGNSYRRSPGSLLMGTHAAYFQSGNAYMDTATVAEGMWASTAKVLECDLVTTFRDCVAC